MDLFPESAWEVGLGMVLKVQSVLIMHRFCVCEFTYSLKFFCNLKISTQGASVVTCRHAQSGGNVSLPMLTVPS